MALLDREILGFTHRNTLEGYSEHLSELLELSKETYSYVCHTQYCNFKTMNKSKRAEQLEKFVRDDPVNALEGIEKLLGREMRPTGGGDSNQILVKHYLVKWKGLSYLHCTWVPEKEFVKAYMKLPHLKTEVHNFDKSMLYYDNSEYEHVPFWPEYAMVDRILACRQHEDGKEYLVKWKFLVYDECHWESDSDISSFQEQIDIFNRLQFRYHNRGVTNSKKRLEEFLCRDKLLPCHLDGLNFLCSSWSKQTHVILSYVTGSVSGKRIQSIAFQASLCEKKVFPHLVVAPDFNLSDWEYVFTRYAPHMNVVKYVGEAAARAVIREYEFYFPESDKNGKKSSCGISETKQERIRFDVLLTSYEMINIDDGLLKSIHWETMIVEEGRRLKSKDSTILLLKQFDTRHRTLLAGAPLKNNLDELFVPLHFVDAGKFANLEEFRKEFRNMNQEEQASRIDKMLAPHLLRNLNARSVAGSALKETPPFHPAGTPISRSKSAEPVEVQTPVDVQEPNISIPTPPTTEMKRKANAKETISANPGAAAAIRPSLQPDTPPLKKTKVSEGGVIMPVTMSLPQESFLSKEEINKILPEVERLLLPSSKNFVKGSTNEGPGMELVSHHLHGLQTALVVSQHFQDQAHAISARETAEVKLSEALEKLKKADGVEAKLVASERELVKTQAELKRVQEEKKVALEEMVSLKARQAEEEVKLSKALAQLKKADGVESKLAASECKLVKTNVELVKVREEKKVALEEMVSLKALHAKEEVKLSEALKQLKKADEVKLAASQRELVSTHAELMRVREEKKVALEEMACMKARHAEEVMSHHVMIEGLDRKVEKLTKELEESEKQVCTLDKEEVEAYLVMRTCTGLMKQVLDDQSTTWKRQEVVDRFVALMSDSDAGCSTV